jgi:hypothetical protein|tara:strand:+ start:49 stop:312 length:264 start_codon:yes stop_codon:yes gene_type:complete
MPTNKNKRKASSHSKPNVVKSRQQSGLITSHPKAFVLVGWLFVVLGIYLLTFESQDNAMFGLAMIFVITGVVTTIYANIALPKKNKD